MKVRSSITFPFAIDPYSFIEQNDGTVSLFDSNDKSANYLLAWGKEKELKVTEVKGSFSALKDFQDINKDWMMGYLSYDLKNDLEELSSNNKDELEFPLLHFYIPKLVIHISKDYTRVEMLDSFSESLLNEMITSARKSHSRSESKAIEITFHGMEEEEYLQHFQALIAHIQRGDIYEVNYCLNFKAAGIEIDPLATYLRLNEQTQAPFSVFHRDAEHVLLCGSPERYLKKVDDAILSQPIKGTIRRGDSPEEDEFLKAKLAQDPKEQAENVMIVDLVRNDLSKIATKASVKVDELFGVYSFRTVHQLISSISCKVDPQTHPVDIIRATFPMGSMTGAPKISAMKLIEAHEDFKRGVYSGAYGYFKPNGDFDFNVVIRSILYNSKKRMLSFPVGGALTSLANAKDEYHECILKAKAMKNALQNS